MSKKPHHLEGLTNILGSLKGEPSPPSPAPLDIAPPLVPKPVQVAPSHEEPAARGRPKSGKKSDPSYVQTSILIKDETRLRVKQALLGSGKGQDVSQLVQNLLEEWLKSHS